MAEVRTPLATSDMMMGLREVALELDLPLLEDLAGFGIDGSLLDSQGGYISIAAFANFLSASAKKYHCPDLGLQIGRQRPKTRFGILTLMVQVCPDVGTALRKGHQYIGLASDTTLWDLQVESGFAVIRRSDLFAFADDLAQIHALSITQYFELLIALIGPNWRPSAVHFVHDVPRKHLRYYQDTFEAPVYFRQQFDGLIFPAKDLETPLATSDPSLLATVETHLESLLPEAADQGIIGKTRALIRQNLGKATCSLEDIAHQINVHPKKLQRDLKTHDLTFKTMVAQQRHELACHYLEHSDLSLTQLSRILGYSSPTAFSRAFKTENGIPPKLWRSSKRPEK